MLYLKKEIPGNCFRPVIEDGDNKFGVYKLMKQSHLSKRYHGREKTVLLLVPNKIWPFINPRMVLIRSLMIMKINTLYRWWLVSSEEFDYILMK